MPFRLPQAKSERLRRRINRAPSPVIARGVPWVSIMCASVLPAWLFIASAPVVPPFGFLMLLAWRQLRPGLLPVWAGLPLGLFDDLFSGQPVGSGILLWSMTIILLDAVEARFPWRGFALEWLVASGLIVAYAALCLGLANATGGATSLDVLTPQLILAVLCYPVVGRLVAWLDRLRLVPIVDLVR